MRPWWALRVSFPVSVKAMHNQLTNARHLHHNPCPSCWLRNAYVHRRKEEDETYVAAARRLLSAASVPLLSQSKMESRRTSSRPDSPAESPRDEPDEEATAEKTEVEESVEPSSFSKLTSFLFGEREEAPTEEAPKEEEEAAAPRSRPRNQSNSHHRLRGPDARAPSLSPPRLRGSRGGTNRATTTASAGAALVLERRRA